MGQTSAVQARRASDFLDSAGVNTHLSWNTPGWIGNSGGSGTTKIASELSYVGIKHVRESTPLSFLLDEYTTLAGNGVRFDFIEDLASGSVDTAEDISRMEAFEKVYSGAIEGYEGANEYNSHGYTLNGQSSSGNLAWGGLDDQAMRTAINASSLLAGVSVVAASTAGGDPPRLPAGSVNITNWHVYAAPGMQLESNIVSGIAAARVTGPGLPVFVTETGTATTSEVGQGYAAVGDERTQAIADVNAVLAGWKNGAARTYLYELADDEEYTGTDTDSLRENSFGIFYADGTPKAAATAWHNLAAILNDNGSNAATFAPGSAPISVTGLPSGASWTLLQSSTGTLDVVIWNGNATIRNSGADVTPSPSTITVDLGQVYGAVSTYDPMQGTAPLSTVSGVSSVSVNLAADPIVVQFGNSGTTISTAAWYTLVNKNSLQCVDASGWGAANGTAIIQWTCGQQQLNQEWQFQPTDSGYYRIINRNAPGEEIDVDSQAMANRSVVHLWQDYAHGNQQWMPVPLGNGSYKLVGRASGRCLDVPGAAVNTGVQLQIYDCNGTAAQAFALNEQP